MILQVKIDFVFYVIVCFLHITWGFSIKILRKTFDSFLFTNLILVRIAALLSVPVTLLFIRKWLNNFAYKASINWWVFIISFTIAAVIVLLTVFIHFYKASRINPVDALRYE
jgi:ABC-type antimicrobial peptide transport system permease subunit